MKYKGLWSVLSSLSDNVVALSFFSGQGLLISIIQTPKLAAFPDERDFCQCKSFFSRIPYRDPMLL